MKNLKLLGGLLMAVLLSADADANLVGPYTPDAHTLFLLHFDETAGGSVTTNVGLKAGNFYTVTNTTSGNGLSAPPPVTTLLGNAGYSGFGRAFSGTNTDGSFNGLAGFDGNNNGAYDADVQGGPASADAIALTNLNIGLGGATPFTIEALICPTSLSANQEILCSDDYNGTRGFQFKITSAGQLQFNLIPISGGSVGFPIPTTGTHKFVAGSWYHVAAVYNGTALSLYWTQLDPTNNVANLLGSVNVAYTSSSPAAPLVIGGENRGSDQESFRGLIDEVRISSAARAANGMQFYSPTVTISPNPASQNVDYGQSVTFSVNAASLTTLGYQWRFNGAPIPGASAFDTNASSYTIPAVTPADAGSYDCVVTNISGNASTSSPAILVVGAANYLVHRYSFTTDTSDSVGGATGTNFGGASVSGGQLVLDGASGSYMQLPGGLFQGFQAATFDFWATFGVSSGDNAHVFDFGNTNGVALGVAGQPNNYLYFSPHSGTVNRLTATPGTSEFEQTASSAGVLDQQSVHVTCVMDPPHATLAIYTNGVLETLQTNYSVPFLSLSDQLAYIGRSLWSELHSDAYLAANIDEFRIYSGALSPNSILQSEILGPDSLPTDGPVQLIAQPADTSIPQGFQVTLSGLAAGRAPFSYQWFEQGALIPGATNRSYTFTAATSQNGHQFQLVVTNTVGGVDYVAASTNATLTVLNPPTIAWLGGAGSTWDTNALNWTNSISKSVVAFQAFDQVLFDDRGISQSSVDLQAALNPLTLTVDSTVNYTLTSYGPNGSLTGPGILVKNNSGTLVLDVDNGMSGPVIISSGVLQIGNFDAYGSLGTGSVTNSAKLSFSRLDNALVVPNEIHGSGSVSYDGGGTVTVSGTNDYTGGTLVNLGIVNVQNAFGLGVSNTVATVSSSGQIYVTANVNVSKLLTLNGSGIDGNGSLRKGGAGLTVLDAPVSLASDAAISVDGGATLSLSNIVSGSAALYANGSGTLALNQADSYTGGTFVSGPVVNVNSSGALGNGLVTFTGAGRLVLGDGVTLANRMIASTVSPGVATGLIMVNDNTNGTITTVSGPLEFDVTAANGGNFMGPNTSGYLNITGGITNQATGVVSSRNGRVRLSGGGDYTSFVLNQGTLSLGANNGLSTKTALQIGSSGAATFDLNGYNQTLTGLTDGATNPKLVTNSASALGTLTLNLTADNTFSGTIAGPLALVQGGGFGLNLSGTNAYTGNTTVNAGWLELAQPTLARNSTLTLASGTYVQLDFSATNQIAGLVLNGVSQPAGLYHAGNTPYVAGVGSLLVASPVASNPTNLVATVRGNNLVLSWPADHTGWLLQVQTNSLANGLGTNWVDVTGSDSVNSMTNAVNPANGAVFYRMILR